MIQLVRSKSLLSLLHAEVMPGFAFPRPFGFYRGSLGPWFPTRPELRLRRLGSRSTVRRYDCLRPSRLVRVPLPTGTLGCRVLLRVPSGLHRLGLVHCSRRTANARVLFALVTRVPACSPKETGGSPEFPVYPSERMPRSQTPVVSRPLALARAGLLPSGHWTQSALGPVARTYPWTTTIHFSELNDAACVLASPLLRTPPLGNRPSVRLPTWWLTFGRVGLDRFRDLTHWVTLTSFKGYHPYSLVPDLSRHNQ